MIGPGTEIDRLLEPYGFEQGDNWLQEILEDETNKLLAALLIELQQQNGNTSAQVPVDNTPDGPSYESHQAITARSSTERSVSLGLTASTVVVHNVTEPITVATEEPGTDHRRIEVEPADSPLTLSGVNGIDAGTVWFQAAEGVSETSFGLIAIR